VTFYLGRKHVKTVAWEIRPIHPITRGVCAVFAFLALSFVPVFLIAPGNALWNAPGIAAFIFAAFLALACGHVAIADRVPAYFIGVLLGPAILRYVLVHVAVAAGALLYFQPDASGLARTLGAWLSATALLRAGGRHRAGSVPHYLLTAAPLIALVGQIVLWEELGIAPDLVSSSIIQYLLYTLATRDETVKERA
jgi:hypothetical protein